MVSSGDRVLRVLWHWFTIGPYHFARMSALASQPGVQLTVVETTSLDDHGWIRDRSAEGFEIVTLERSMLSREVHRKTRWQYLGVLRRTSPDVVIECGFSEPHSRSALAEYKEERRDLLTLFWSETTALDKRRHSLQEKMKKWVVSQFDGALVAGKPHARYLESLGLSRDVIAVVGGTVDNAMFAEQADAARRLSRPAHIPERSFLYVGRFLPVKNLPFLIRAYAAYRDAGGDPGYELVLIGSGPEEEGLRRLIDKLGVRGVRVPGTKQVRELASYYAFASCLVLPSLSEPWGLVVNEAMASGLPVLVSARCGCVEDLIQPGVTGYVFDPTDIEALRDGMLRIASSPDVAARMGEEGRRRIWNYGPEDMAAKTAVHIRELHDRRKRAGFSGAAVLHRLTDYVECCIR